MSIIKVYVTLLEEGTDTIRPTQAEEVGIGLYRLFPSPKYDPEDEIWEFVPGTVVKIKEIMTDKGETVLLAVKG